MLPVGIGLLSAALAAGPSLPPSAETTGGGCGARPRGDLTQDARAALAEGALERPLAPQRLVAPPPRRARGGQRAGAAARDAGQAHGRPEIHQRLPAPWPEAMTGPLAHPPDGRVIGEHGRTAGERRDGIRGVPPDSGLRHRFGDGAR